jgi:hypothetical protein
MFSHIINNPNNLEIEDDYFVIPFGHRCTSASACIYANIRKCSLPFDWTVPSLPSKIQKVLENNFDDFIPDVHNGKFYNKYNIGLAHFNTNISIGIEEYKRRIERFNNIINKNKKIYFVYINEDYLYNSKYRDNKFIDNNFYEMLELEKFIKNKYNYIDYSIIYFDFKYHNIPNNSNIINIVLNYPNVYNKESDCKELNVFRMYCGKILTELFNTTFNNLSYNQKLFNN